MKERDVRVDLIKLITTAMVVVLHTIENTRGYLQQCLYLLGTFGIPLFLTVNGYLLYNRDFDDCLCEEKRSCNVFALYWGA